MLLAMAELCTNSAQASSSSGSSGEPGHTPVTRSPHPQPPKAANITHFWALTPNLGQISLRVLRNLRAPSARSQSPRRARESSNSFKSRANRETEPESPWRGTPLFPEPPRATPGPRRARGRHCRALAVLVSVPAVMGPTMPISRTLTDMNRPYLWCRSVKRASSAAGTWKAREETSAHRNTPYHISAGEKRCEGGPGPAAAAAGGPRSEQGGTWEGGERAGVGGGAIAHAGHEAKAEDLLQEPPAAAARFAALHPPPPLPPVPFRPQ